MSCKVFLKQNEEIEIRQGFPWVFDNEIENIKGQVTNGDVVDIYSKSGLFLGCGIINQNSKITVRIITTDKNYCSKSMEVYDEDFFIKKIEDALAIRYMYFHKNDSYRLIFAEADFLPGLIVERYVDISGRVFLVVQFLAMAVEVFRENIIKALQKICKPFGIFERSDAAVREKEGLEQKAGWIGAEHNPIITIKENGVLLEVDLEKGQKTGYFLDQKFNRAVVANFAKGKTVLDTFTHTGAFGLNAVLFGAKEVISVDISEEAIKTVNKNIFLNKCANKMHAVCADVFDLLKEYESSGKKFDMIILDPPAFAKSAKALQKAFGGYKEINLRAMKLLNPGGILVTCSCSHFMDTNTFTSMIMHAAIDAHKNVQILEKRGAGPDHPVLCGYPKSEYLKCVICKII